MQPIPHSSSDGLDPTRRAARIRKVIEDCMVRREAGERLSDDMITTANRDLLPELKEELAVLSMIERARVGFGSSGELPNLLATPQVTDQTSVEQLLAFRGYSVSREIHRGGQGVVYEAVQRSTGKRVAVKLLHESGFDSGRDRARFEREVHILGLLQHPNIVAIHDSGTIAGHRYLVMDLIEGDALGAFDPTADRSSGDASSRASAERSSEGAGPHTANAGEPIEARQPISRPVSDIFTALRQFIKICDAVNAAHLHGVIHRDLKPSNILIDRAGEPHVLDFGLAKVAHNSTLAAQTMTAAGQFIGSLPWASPEQADGEGDAVDIRTDVYSLGVVLYQLLTGHFPYPIAGNWRAVAETIVHTEPRPPRLLRHDIDDDLQRIVLKSLSKDPARRYQSAGELGKDLSRYLGHEPVTARGDSTWYIMTKLARRHRVKATIAAAFLVLIAGSAVVMTLLYQGQRRALQIADEEHRNAEDALQLAELRLTEARNAERTASQSAAKAAAINEFLQGMLEAPDPFNQGKDVKVADMLEQAAKSVHEKFTDQPLVEADVRITIGQTYQGLGDLRQSEEQFREARRLRFEALGEDSRETIEASYLLASTLWLTGKLDEAETLAREVVEAKTAHLGDELDDEAEGALSLYAYILNARGRFNESIPIARRNYEYLLNKLGENDMRTVAAMNDLAFSLDSGDLNDEAEQLYKVALDRAHAALGPDHGVTQSIQANYANLLRSLGRVTEVEPMIRQVLESRRRTLPPNNPLIADCLLELAGVYGAKGDAENALVAVEEALQINEASLGKTNWRTAGSYAYRSNILCALKRYEDSEEDAIKAVDVLKLTWGEHPSCERMTQQVVLGLYTKWSRPDKVEEWKATFESMNAPADATEKAADSAVSE